MKSNTQSFKKGFTLIEMLAVIAIIGTLTAVILPNLSGSKAKSRDARRIAELKALQQAVDSYRQDNCQPSFSTQNTQTSSCNFPSLLQDLSPYFNGNDWQKDPQDVYYEYSLYEDPPGTYHYCIGTKLEVLSVSSMSDCLLNHPSSSDPSERQSYSEQYYRVGGP